MKRLLKTLGVPLLIALVCVGLLAMLQRWRPTLFVPLDIAAADLLMLREDGPHLGRRDAHEDIVLVMIDQSTSRARGGDLPTYEEDLALYRILAQARARVIVDTRMVAAADEEGLKLVRPLLRGMLDLQDRSAVKRDIWLPVNTAPGEFEQWRPCISPVVMNLHPSAFRAFETRMCPLVTFMNTGPVETLPLQVYRAYHGIAPRDARAVDAELARCGIFVSWAVREDVSEYRTKSPPCYQVGDLAVPWYQFPSTSTLVPPAAFWLAYDAPPSEFPRFSYSEVLAGSWSEPFAGKIVIIGNAAEIDPTDETYTVPTALEKVSMAEVAAIAVQTLLDERFPREMPLPMQILVSLALVAALVFTASRLRPVMAVIVSLGVLCVYWIAAAIAYREGWHMSVLLVPTTGIVAGGLGLAYQLLGALRARMRIVDLFGRYVPRAVVQQLVQKPEIEALAVGGVRRDVTVMFADIRGFTSFSEQLDPEAVLTELNSLLDGMVACTFESQGTLDKFIGDAILVLFNAPLDQPDHARRAVDTALKIQAKVAGHPSGLSIGIGIHTGEAVVGNIGTPERMEYTAIGSTVNVASRLCDLARPGEIVVSDVVASTLSDQFRFEQRPPIRVKGIQRELNVAVVAGKQED